MKNLLIIIAALSMIFMVSKQANSQIANFEISEHCDNDFEFYLTVTLVGMSSISNDYTQITFSSGSLQLYNDTDMPGTDAIYESAL